MMSTLESTSFHFKRNDTLLMLAHYEREMMEARIPSMTIALIQILVGVSGNAFVIHFYKRFSHRRSGLFYFIPWLAFFDITAIISIGTFSVLQDIFTMSFPSLYLCQSLWFGVVFCSSTGAFCLLLIAVQRYCFVFQKPVLNGKWHRSLVIISVLFSGLIAIPVFFMVELRDISVARVNKKVCGDTLNEQKLLYKYSYFHCLLLLTFINIVFITALYIRIGFKTFQMQKRQSSLSKYKRSGVKFSLMCVVVFGVYFVAYMPTYVINLLPDDTKTKLFNTPGDDSLKVVAILVAHRMLIFSHVLNPFIFFLFHARFRREIRKCFKCMD